MPRREARPPSDSPFREGGGSGRRGILAPEDAFGEMADPLLRLEAEMEGAVAERRGEEAHRPDPVGRRPGSLPSAPPQPAAATAAFIFSRPILAHSAAGIAQ